MNGAAVVGVRQRTPAIESRIKPDPHSHMHPPIPPTLQLYLDDLYVCWLL